ncbi:endolytic transglycosylase MltG [Nitratireductor sp. XY-223]|uniref:endolytic transglycosylase MltG n=1 Tax=Nitratireductor sp. XY-223 TaxID=2561926 RepID=UPI0010A9FFD5|nr:endolytic transglycosylase MltG [Nitratireductor sp. XY-223]
MSDGNISDDQSGFGRSRSNGPIVPQSARQALKPEEAPQPPKRSERARSQFVVFMNFMLSLVVFLMLAAAGAVYFGKIQFDGAGPLARNTLVTVREGSGVNTIAEMLQNRNVISSATIFKFGVSAYMPDDTLKAGEYEIKAGASMRDVMELLRSGKSILHSITLAEGLTVEQIFNRISSNSELTGDLPEELPPEGSLRPETYKFTRGTTRAEIVDQMRAAQARLIDEIWEDRRADLPIKTKEEFVTLASIVEKETGRADERTLVASVFLNRIERGMRLQSDPTIIYGLFGGKGKPSDRPIYQSDIKKPTPYNTYVIDGLPPTPIANPGRAALEAVANPSQTNNVYFVADGTGGHVFAETLEQHNRNVRRWRQIEAERAKQDEKAAE